jgi:hypothetical protein
MIIFVDDTNIRKQVLACPIVERIIHVHGLGNGVESYHRADVVALDWYWMMKISPLA